MGREERLDDFVKMTVQWEFPDNVADSSRVMEVVAMREKESLAVGLSPECLQGAESMPILDR